MKKLLALVLALIMVLGLGVTAFADVAKLNIIVLDEEDEDEDEPEKIITLPEFADDLKGDNETIYLAGPKGDDYYLEIANYDAYKNITVTTTGSVTAEIVEFDGDELCFYDDDHEYQSGDVEYAIFDTKGANPNSRLYSDKLNDLFHDKGDMRNINGNQDDWNATAEGWKKATAIADDLNDLYKTSDRFVVKAITRIRRDTNNVNIVDKHLLKITTADNYSAAYKEGTVKLTATVKGTKDTVIAKLTVISDVNIFEYEEVKWAADNDALVIYSNEGYSDYLTAKLGYNLRTNEASYDPYDLRTERATVVSTTAFRAIEGEELQVASEAGDTPAILVTIDEVAKGQKGVNFAFDPFTYYDEDGEKLAENKAKGSVEYFEFGFLGDQVIASDFEIEVKLKKDPYELRELFGKKVEEEDIITYYVLKDGVKIDEFTIDYKDDDMDEDVELEILGKAGDKLGYYTVTLDAPAAEEGEENPNTGAESVVGVVAAMAVISLATAAAVSLKK